MVPADKAEEAKVLVNGLSVGAAPKLPSSKDSVENDGISPARAVKFPCESKLQTRDKRCLRSIACPSGRASMAHARTHPPPILRRPRGMQARQLRRCMRHDRNPIRQSNRHHRLRFR
jgi:hypothetical protein